MSGTTAEHVLLESDEREIPQRLTARKIHAHHVLRSRLRRRRFELDLIDYYFLSVRVWRGASLLSEYTLDLRFVDPEVIRSRRIAWRWIAATLTLLTVLALSVWRVSVTAEPWWQHDWWRVWAGLFVAAACAGTVAAYLTSEQFTLRSVYGRATLLNCKAGLGMLRSLRTFNTRLAAHIRLAISARRSTKAAHLRDEMREHFRLKEAGVLGEEEYEASKARILGTHSSPPSGRLASAAMMPAVRE